jgi:hypothetical protein
MSNKDYGGRITMRLSTGETFSLRGSLSMNTAGQSNEAVTNQDGSTDRVGTVQPRRVEITFADRGINHDKLMKAPRFNVTFDEEFTNVQHMFTDAFVVGDPSINRMNGEVTGFSIAADAYSRRAD